MFYKRSEYKLSIFTLKIKQFDYIYLNYFEHYLFNVKVIDSITPVIFDKFRSS